MVITLNGYTTTLVNFNSAMVCTFKFRMIIPYQPISFAKLIILFGMTKEKG